MAHPSPRTVLITGCSSGFGLAMVSEFLGRGWTVLATLRNLSARSGLFELHAPAEQLELLELDVRKPEDREAAVARVRAKGGLDCLINNAGYGLFGALEDLSEAQLRDALETNFFGAALLTRGLLPALRERKGAVVNVSSVMGFAGSPLSSAYCASKYALEGLTESLYHELAPHGVRVMLVEPGGHRTAFAAKVAWGEGRTPAFARATRNYRDLAQRLSTRGRGNPPERVAARIAELVHRNKELPLRLPIGSSAHLLSSFQRLTPEPVKLALLSRMYRRIFQAEES